MKRLLLAFAGWLALSGTALALVNINTATKDELTSIKGVGAKRAQEIVDYRNKHGEFKSVDDLAKVPGIGPGLLKQLRSELTVSATLGSSRASQTASKTKPTFMRRVEAPKSEAIPSGRKDRMAEKFKAEEKKSAKK